jgi:hypothetical protein
VNLYGQGDTAQGDQVWTAGCGRLVIIDSSLSIVFYLVFEQGLLTKWFSELSVRELKTLV